MKTLIAFLVGLAMANPIAAFKATEEGELILIVVTNCGTMEPSGKETGYWLAEVAHPWVLFKEAGYGVEFASPEGGFAPMDPRSFDLEDEANRTFWHNLEAVEGLANTQKLAEVIPGRFAAIYFAGGHGTMWDFPDSEAVQRVAAEAYEAGGVVAAVCHGPAALVNVRLSDGTFLVEGKRVAGFTNEEEMAVGLKEDVPFLLEDVLRERGAEVITAPNYQPNAIASGRLVTGQNPASAGPAAEKILELLGEDPIVELE